VGGNVAKRQERTCGVELPNLQRFVIEETPHFLSLSLLELHGQRNFVKRFLV
jgi:hypothetical protein